MDEVKSLYDELAKQTAAVQKTIDEINLKHMQSGRKLPAVLGVDIECFPSDTSCNTRVHIKNAIEMLELPMKVEEIGGDTYPVKKTCNYEHMNIFMLCE